MKPVIIVCNNPDVYMLREMSMKYPEVEIISTEEAGRRNINLNEAEEVVYNYTAPPKLPDLKVPYFQHVSKLNMDSQQWKRRGKNTKI